MTFNVSDVSTTKMTSKGQVVIPEEIREHMGLESGVKFLVMASDDAIIFKKIHPVPEQDFKALLEASHRFAKEQGITEKDIEQAIADVRKKRKAINPFTGEPTVLKKKPTLAKNKSTKAKKIHSKGKTKSSN